MTGLFLGQRQHVKTCFVNLAVFCENMVECHKRFLQVSNKILVSIDIKVNCGCFSYFLPTAHVKNKLKIALFYSSLAKKIMDALVWMTPTQVENIEYFHNM